MISNMQKKIKRSFESQIQKKLQNNPVVALLGPRQVGKSTLAKGIIAHYPHSIYLDLEKASDRSKIEADPEFFFRQNPGKLICLDEIQLLPEIFMAIRSYVDESDKNSQFLILGSASRDLIKQSSETLAGRISYIEITPFHFLELDEIVKQEDHWLKGGYPRSILQEDLEESFDWRENYIKTFLERDIPQLGFSIPAKTLERFWQMLAHTHGQIINYSNLGKSLGVSHHTIKSYIDILEQTFVIRSLSPYFTNEKKRLIKSPKIYVRDTGLLLTLLRIADFNSLLGHPVYGVSFESYVLENILINCSRWKTSFYRDSVGNEIDLVLERANKLIVIEIKASTSPKLESGFWNSVKYLNPVEMWVISLVEEPYVNQDGVQISNLKCFLERMKNEL
jgi:uncharacterized protein